MACIIWCLAVVLGARGDSATVTPFRGDGSGRQVLSKVILVGDVQRTGFWERLLLREQNDEARPALFRRIAEENPAFVVILGDIVANGGDAGDWSMFDRWSQPLRNNGVPVVAVPGNHDYSGGKGLTEFHRRFPDTCGDSWKCLTFRGVAVLLLNSNFSELSPAEVDSQDAWYCRTLVRIDADSTVRAIVVCCHHPPFTNSTVVFPSEAVERQFGQPFMRSLKGRLFVAGHCHSYEHFKQGGKTFIVTGGGGGPRQRVIADRKQQRIPDLFRGPSNRPLHFCRLLIGEKKLRFQMVALNPELGTFYLADEFTIGN